MLAVGGTGVLGGFVVCPGSNGVIKSDWYPRSMPVQVDSDGWMVVQKMQKPSETTSDEQLQQLLHNVQGHLHAIGMGIQIIRDGHVDPQRCREVCDLIDAEHNKAVDLKQIQQQLAC